MEEQAETDVRVKPEFSVPKQNLPRHDAGMNQWHGTKQDTAVPHLCFATIQNKPCQKPNCPHFHDIAEFLAKKPASLEQPCPFYTFYGVCPFSYNCLFQHDKQRSPGDFSNPAFAEPLPLPNDDFQTDFSPELLKNLRQGKCCGSVSQPPFCYKPRSLILAPMCSVATIPFRRLCKDFGADVTFSEMVVARLVLQGDLRELKKMRKSREEDVFGVQITGNPDELSKLAKMIAEKGIADIIDVNAACPQDAATRFQCGFAIAQKNGKIRQILQKLDELDVNLSLKTRIGDFKGNDIQDRLISEISGVKHLRAVCVHGRSAKQRYGKTADWEKLREFKGKLAQMKENGGSDAGLFFIGNGDVFTPRDAEAAFEVSDAIMLGRGALIKPWIFKEIKEGRELDLSSSERLEICRKFGRYCLELFGTDAYGVEKAREQFLENWNWMSRYVPVGIREGEQALNQRVPPFKGRDELETLMGSQSAADWVKISEMVFGPVPKGFAFQPKHKSKGNYQKEDSL